MRLNSLREGRTVACRRQAGGFFALTLLLGLLPVLQAKTESTVIVEPAAGEPAIAEAAAPKDGRADEPANVAS